MLPISPTLSIPSGELDIDFIRASGPGGQNVNKVATAVQLRFDVRNSPSLTEEVKKRLSRLAGTRMSQDGILVIQAKRFRAQDLNRADAILRFTSLVRRALEAPKIRRPTHPSSASRRQRVDFKKRRGKLKRLRQTETGIED